MKIKPYGIVCNACAQQNKSDCDFARVMENAILAGREMLLEECCNNCEADHVTDCKSGPVGKHELPRIGFPGDLSWYDECKYREILRNRRQAKGLDALPTLYPPTDEYPHGPGEGVPQFHAQHNPRLFDARRSAKRRLHNEINATQAAWHQKYHAGQAHRQPLAAHGYPHQHGSTGYNGQQLPGAGPGQFHGNAQNGTRNFGHQAPFEFNPSIGGDGGHALAMPQLGTELETPRAPSDHLAVVAGLNRLVERLRAEAAENAEVVTGLNNLVERQREAAFEHADVVTATNRLVERLIQDNDNLRETNADLEAAEAEKEERGGVWLEQVEVALLRWDWFAFPNTYIKDNFSFIYVLRPSSYVKIAANTYIKDHFSFIYVLRPSSYIKDHFSFIYVLRPSSYIKDHFSFIYELVPLYGVLRHY
ncbi:uncharacterized protein RCC_06854 [Ramularia collo-cygni]|uniref:Uncharacterized protein n=1 Tax=Ramularia collo-cygni TaxID=112498 RepID=A0A2D3VJA9_9PEZI|nr:uncharacterized protein RCC_06854 [Ramularia collo-cygni]CZT20993.1 uncharacterized protein RCC_06854 [Ramularia collo-cygni]